MDVVNCSFQACSSPLIVMANLVCGMESTRFLVMSSDKAISEPDTDFERLRRYSAGAELIFTNAEALYNEAHLLGQAGSFARAAVLHQISIEECAKINALGTAATAILIGEGVNETQLEKAFRNHKFKNKLNAYDLPAMEEEKTARARGEWGAAQAAFKETQQRFHDEVNGIKNAGLYVEFKDGEFIAPIEVVDAATANVLMGMNANYLKRSHDFVKLLQNMISKPEFYEGLFSHFTERAEELLAAGKSDPIATLDILMTEMAENYMKTK
jgi:AbiV family abortive infection protein